MMTIVTHDSSRAGQKASESDILIRIAIFCGVGLLLSLACMSYGIDLSPGFF